MAESGIVPAQVGFLAVYNPSLGSTDETIDDQIVYYASIDLQSGTRSRRRLRSRACRPTDSISHEEQNERLRQIGLAQGMVEFGKSFSGNKPVDTIDTVKSRVVLHELEPGWWILASIDLTRQPVQAVKNGNRSSAPALAEPEKQFEYSSREVKPAALLLQELLRAHAIFLLHHDSSLSALFVRSKRDRFSSMLGRYWDQFLACWSVLIDGNPTRNVFRAIKIAASGELGVGVGEEDRGSGEREVLEGLVGRVEGLVDLVVSKFGEVDLAAEEKADGEIHEQGSAAGDLQDSEDWLGAGREPAAEDGTVFLGVGALSRHSLRNISYWMEDVYTWGEKAYGVGESPTATRARARRSRENSDQTIPQAASARQNRALPTIQTDAHPALPPPVLNARKGSHGKVVAAWSASSKMPSGEEAEHGSMDKLMAYLKLGYGTSWSFGASTPSERQGKAPMPEEPARSRPGSIRQNSATGHYLIGLMGDVEESSEDGQAGNHGQETESNSRTVVRTITVELETDSSKRPESEMMKDLGSGDNELTKQRLTTDGVPTSTAERSFDSQDRNKTRRLRVVVYVNRPFIFTLLFHLRTDSLAFDGLYRSLHNELAPLHKPLVRSTEYRPTHPEAGCPNGEIYHLIWDPRAMTLHSTIPNIADPAVTPRPGPWSRLEALNTHMQILNIFTNTRSDLSSELERTCKTSRGYWVVWKRMLEPAPLSALTPDLEYSSAGDYYDHSQVGDDRTPRQEFIVSKEVILVRKASDQTSARDVSVPYAEPGWADGASRLVQGIGLDTRRYIDGLLSMHR